MKLPDPECPVCGGSGSCDSGASSPWGDWIRIPCSCFKEPLTNPKSGLEIQGMNIETKPGSKIVYSDPAIPDLRASYSGGDSVKGILELEESYTVKEIEIGSFTSNVILEEFPDKRFNTVHFKNL